MPIRYSNWDVEKAAEWNCLELKGKVQPGDNKLQNEQQWRWPSKPWEKRECEAKSIGHYWPFHKASLLLLPSPQSSHPPHIPTLPSLIAQLEVILLQTPLKSSLSYLMVLIALTRFCFLLQCYCSLISSPRPSYDNSPWSFLSDLPRNIISFPNPCS